MPRFKLNSEHIILDFGQILIENGDASIKSVITAAQEEGMFSQLITAKAVVSPFHVLAAYEQAKGAVENKHAFARSLELEFLLRLTAQTQLEEAFKILQFSKGNQSAVMISAGSTSKKVANFTVKLYKKIGFKPLKKVPSPDPQKIKSLFKISDSSLVPSKGSSKLEQLENAVIEKMALIELEK